MTFSVLQLIDDVILCVYPVSWEVTDVAEVGVNGQTGRCLPVDVLHLLQPAVFLCVALVGFLEIFGRVALQSFFLRLGPCLRLAMGGAGKTFFRSGLSVIIVL